jgi:DNA primase
MNDKFYKQMAKLTAICYEQLIKNRVVHNYLIEERKISKKTIDKFYLGAFPTDLRVLLKEFDPLFLINNGILYQADKSPFNLYPIIFPICDVNDNFVGIAGRTLMPEKQFKKYGYPKYKNSKYDKAHHLFGLNYAKQSIRDKNNVIVVEGYFDVISSHQAGITNVVGTSGAYLSSHQVMLLSRYTDNISLLFDNDETGQRAGKKAFEQISCPGVALKKIVLPKQYKDIDELIVSGNVSLFTENTA